MEDRMKPCLGFCGKDIPFDPDNPALRMCTKCRVRKDQIYRNAPRIQRVSNKAIADGLPRETLSDL